MGDVERIARSIYSTIEEHIGHGTVRLVLENDKAIIQNIGFPNKRAVFDIQNGAVMCTVELFDDDNFRYDSRSSMKAYQFDRKLVFLSGMLYGELTTY